MLHRIRPTSEVARTRTGMTGVTNVVLGTGKARRVLTFGPAAVYVRGTLPPEIADSPFLLREPVTEAELVRAPADVIDLGGTEATPIAIPENLDALTYPDLKKLAAELGLSAEGKKERVLARIVALRDAQLAAAADKK